jgi:hypothetical protein
MIARAIFHCQGKGGGDGSAYSISAGRGRGDGEVSYDLSMVGVTSGFEAALGYVPEKGVHEVAGQVQYAERPTAGPYWRKT